MMVTPRAFLHAPVPADSLTSVNFDHNGVAESIKPMLSKGKKAGAAKPARLLNAPPASPSKPVIIPTRARNEGQRRCKGSNPNSAAIMGDSASRHDPYSIPPSAAALMAMTALPESRHNSSSRNLRRKRFQHALCNDELQISTGSEVLKPSSSSSSPQSWGILLSPPDESEQETASITSDSNLGPLQCSVDSLSSDSVPSLEGDAESITSSSNLSTSAMSLISRRGSRERRSKTLSGEDCLLDHPLIPKIPDCDMDCEALDEAYALEIRSSSRSAFPFKSNLTASLRMLKSAATSLSNFTAATVLRDEYLVRSLLFISPQFTDERRPLPSADVPDPALRRYLNPITLSPAELHFHPDPAPHIHCTSSIQLQTYHRAFKAPLHHNKATAPPVFISHPLSRSLAHDGEPFTSALSPSMSRQREPRENSDFLRIIVLEMNMRKVGKLSESAPGKAKLWLPARQILPISAEEADSGPVPRRWVGTTA